MNRTEIKVIECFRDALQEPPHELRSQPSLRLVAPEGEAFKPLKLRVNFAL